MATRRPAARSNARTGTRQKSRQRYNFDNGALAAANADGRLPSRCPNRLAAVASAYGTRRTRCTRDTAVRHFIAEGSSRTHEERSWVDPTEAHGSNGSDQPADNLLHLIKRERAQCL